MWGTYPKHELEKLPVIPEVKLDGLKIYPPNDKKDKVYHEDFVNKFFKKRNWEKMENN